MNWKNWFSLGYTLEEWKRDRHTLAVIILTWLAVDIQPLMTGTMDLATFKNHALIAVSTAVASFLKSLVTNNDPSLK